MIVRRVITLAAACLVCAGLLGTRPTSAGEGFQPPSPDELKMTSEPKAPGAPAVILFREVDRDDIHNQEYNYYRIKILTEEGRKQADVEIPIWGGKTAINSLHARTIQPDGSISNFDGKVYEKTLEKSRNLKILEKTFTLPNVQVGSIIEYYYSQDFAEHWVFDSHWILSESLYTKHAKFSLKPFHSSYQNLPVRWSWQGLPPGTEQPKEGPDGVVRLEVSDIPAFQTEDFMPPENELKSRVDFIYSEEAQESDTAKFWKKVGKKRYDQAESFAGKRKAMEQAVAQIVAPNDPPETKLQKIYARVQKLRNTTFEVQKTEQEQKREKPKELHNVEDVWKEGYGDSDQLDWLFLGLVRAAGFEAYPVVVSARNDYFFNPVRQNPNELNANVVLVKLNGKDIYCDPGVLNAPYGLLPWYETGVQGLRLDKDGGTWVQTTLPPSTDTQIERKAALKMTEEGALEGKLTVTFTGLEALWRRHDERNEDEVNRRKFLEDEVKDFVPAGIDVELTNKPDWTSSDPSLVAEFNLKVPGWAAAAGHRATIPVGLFSAPEKHMFEHSSRVNPIYMRYPYLKTDDVTVELPFGWEVSSLPKNQKVDGNIILYTMDVKNHKSTFEVERQLKVDILGLETKYYPTLRAFFQAVKAGDEEQIVVQPGTP